MITSQKQLSVAKQKAKLLKASLDANSNSNLPESIQRAAKGQVSELLNELEREIGEYEALSSGKLLKLKIGTIDDLMEAPIRYRIANGMSVEDFAKKVDVHSRQIARYEAEKYRNATTETLLKIWRCIGIEIAGTVTVGDGKPPRKRAMTG